MSNITYLKGDILGNANYPRILIHSCNCEGSWGGGIAYQLAQRYPKSEQIYQNICDRYGDKLLGECVLIRSFEDDNLIICCLFNSSFGGSSHDFQDSILSYTRRSINRLSAIIYQESSLKKHDMDEQLDGLMETSKTGLPKDLVQYKLELPKINSGIFGVPWVKTEQVLKEYSGGDHPLHFTVYSL